MSLRRFSLTLFLTLGSIALFTAPVWAQTDFGVDAFGASTGLGNEDVRVIVAKVIRMLLSFIGIVAFAVIVYGGIKWMTASGRNDAVADAQKIMINGAIGLAITLSAFAITQFVITRLLDATGAGGSASLNDGSSGYSSPPPGFGGSGFSLLGITPASAVPIRNVVVAFSFSSNVQAASVENNIVITPVGSSDAVRGTFTTQGSTVRFTPAEPCPEPNGNRRCFAENTAYEVRVASGLRGTNGTFVNCAFRGCTGQFSTGSLVDILPPTLRWVYPDRESVLPVNEDITLALMAEDDAGIGLVEGRVADVVIGTDAPEANTGSFNATLSWDTAGLMPNTRHTLQGIATDIAGNESPMTVVEPLVRAATCFNTILDADEGETGVDCGGDEESETYCGACAGSTCTDDSVCSGGHCVENVCVALPEVTHVLPLSGAIGNYVTIQGSLFGAVEGTVLFLGDVNTAADDVRAPLACSGAWSANEVIVQVPVGAISGPIRLVANGGAWDETADANGPMVGEFTVNNVREPGVCAMRPVSAEIGEEITITGVNLSAESQSTNVYFGDIPAGSIRAASPTSVRATVPPRSVGPTEVTVWLGSMQSNPLRFTVRSGEATAAPVIAAIEPASGPVGAYITLTGSNFGSRVGTVRFLNEETGAEALGDVSFPQECAEQYWRPNSITVKVPSEYQDRTDVTLFTHRIRVVRADGTESAQTNFAVEAGNPGPGICAVSPIAAGPGSLVQITGEHFGNENGSVGFGGNTTAAISSWTSTSVQVTVPLEAETGEGRLTSAAGDLSNTFLFEVESCDPDEANACGAGYQCCASTNACMPVAASCENVVPQTNYLFTFSTGTIPLIPRVLEQCQPASTLNRVVSPTPWDGRVGGAAVCVNAIIGAQFNLPMDPTTLTDATMEVRNCPDGDCEEGEVMSGSYVSGSQHITFTPTTNFTPGTQYQITIDGALSADGVAMAAPYVWNFTADPSGAICEITGVTVMPDDVVLTGQGNGVLDADDTGDALLTASGTGDDACILLNVDGGITWSVGSNVSSGAVQLVANTAPASTLVKALTETINTVAARVIATFVRNGVNGAANVTVDFTNPAVLEAWPNCSDACVGAEVGALFNTALDATTISSSTVHLSRCTNELCVGSLTSVATRSPTLRNEGKEIVLTPRVALEGNTYYRVVLDEAIASPTGAHLTGLNYGPHYSWIFRTRADGAACVVDHVDMSPERATARAVGDLQSFEAVPVTAPDSCSSAGQRVAASSLNWAWDSSNTSTATLLSGGILDRPLSVGAGCTSSCVLAGSNWYRAVCGNSIVESGEECDTGNVLPGDGCSASCLWEGKETCANPTDPSCCGNAVVESGEECDDANALSGDGCSTLCLREGSASVGATCGNGGVPARIGASDGGEDCDDGNTRSGDGCSVQCLNEGSVSGPIPVCGNGTVETGEECDDRNAMSGDGCSTRCVFEGANTMCTAIGQEGCCGNGRIEGGNFENCDGGEGCSSRCELEGSSLEYRTFSLCGDGVLGAGEAAQCDGPLAVLGEGDGRVDAYQFAQVSEQLSQQTRPENGRFSTTISAEEGVSRAQGDALFEVACSCTASSQCPTSGASYGCGEATQCCFSRPSVPTIQPVGTGQCRNAQVHLAFAELMNEESFVSATNGPQVALKLLNVSAPNCPRGYTSQPLATPSVTQAFWPRLMARAWNRVAQSVGALTPGGCYLPVNPLVHNMGDHTEVTLQYAQALEPASTYQIEVYGDQVPSDAQEQGVLSINGVALSAIGNANGIAMSGQFTTGSDLCDADVVEVEDTSASPGLFLQENEAHGFFSTVYSQLPIGRFAIQALPGVYDWTIRWTVADTNTEENIVNLDDAVGEEELATSQQTNGKATLAATLTVITPASELPRVLSGSANAQVMLCEIPWPDSVSTPGIFEAPFTDTDGNNDGLLKGNGWTNLSTLYCRAEQGDNAAPLPDFLVTQVGESPNAQVQKEWILRHPTKPEAIGIRVLENESYLPASAWFSAQGFAGQSKEVTVDGYRAVQDGRTTYVSTSLRSSGEEVPVIVALSYSEGASPETIEIFNQISANMRFHGATTGPDVITSVQACKDQTLSLIIQDGQTISCTNDLECVRSSGNSAAWCDADQEKLRRDLNRLEDIRTMENALYAYGATHKHCSVTTGLTCYTDSQCPGSESCKSDVPLLDAGTYLRGWSLSTWPSWQAELGNEIGGALPVDPVNRFNTCAEGADPDSCWNTTTSLFSCPVGSQVYGYRRDGVFDYELWTDLESARTPWALPFTAAFENGQVAIGGFSAIGQTPTAMQCSGALYGSSGVCGDGLIGADEVCERGQTSTEVCGTDQIRVTTCNTTCSGYTADSDGIMPGNPDYSIDSACVIYGCNNGVVEGRCVGSTSNNGGLCMTMNDCPGGACSLSVADGAEECDDGSNNGRYGYCSATCTYGTAMRCGNGRVEGAEVCDQGALNGLYTATGSGCSFDCSNAGLFCGDGIRNGNESCDSEYETWAGGLCVNTSDPSSSTFAPCASTSECTVNGEICGSSLISNSQACVPDSFCAGGENEGDSCESNADCEVASSNDGVCTSYNTYRSRQCQTVGSTACSWSALPSSNPWSSCQRQGSCGDTVIDPGETCDDGNENNNDSCTSTCRTNVCGDGFLNPNVEACDLGSDNVGTDNGDVCTAPYGGSCNYCSTSCTYQTITGGFCGDATVDPGEVCDGNTPRYLWEDPANRIVGAACTDVSNPDCKVLGACNGGPDQGLPCDTTASHACGGSGVCIASVCDASCGNSCPFNYQSVYALTQPYFDEVPVPGAPFGNVVELHSYQTNGLCGGDTAAGNNVGAFCNEDSDCDSELCVFEAPEAASVSLPACRVASRLTADVSYQIEYPNLDVMFVLDQSGSMANTLGSSTRWETVRGAVSEAIDTLYRDYPGTTRVGLVTYGRPSIDGPTEYTQGGVPQYQPLWTSDTAQTCEENYYVGGSATSADHYAYTWPENWEDIVSNNSVASAQHNAAACVQLLPTISEAEVQSTLTSLALPVDAYTPMEAGLDRAEMVLERYPEDHVRVAILLTDGAMSCRYFACHVPTPSTTDDSDNLEVALSGGQPIQCPVTGGCVAATGNSAATCEMIDGDYDPPGTANGCYEVVESLLNRAGDIKDDGVQIYTAMFRDDLDSNNGLRDTRTLNILSSDCEWPKDASALALPSWFGLETHYPYTRLVDQSSPYSASTSLRYFARFFGSRPGSSYCTPNPVYSYTSNGTQSEIETMMQNIIQNIINARLTIGSNTSAQTTTIRRGPGVTIPLPNDFTCNSADATPAQVHVQFGGTGTVTLSNMRFFHCPAN